MKKILIATLVVVSLLLLTIGAMADQGDDKAKFSGNKGKDCKR